MGNNTFALDPQLLTYLLDQKNNVYSSHIVQRFLITHAILWMYHKLCFPLH